MRKFNVLLACFVYSLLFFLSACSESFTDARDGQSYRVVQIGSQTWMAENLNFAVPLADGAGKDADGAAASSCPDGSERNCKKMGRLYTWEAAQMACPEGWRLPSREDFEALVKVAGGSAAEGSGDALKSTSGWFKKGNGSNAFGFEALPAGYKRQDGKFDGIGGYAYFWSSSEDPDGASYYLVLDFSSPAAKLNAFGKGEGRSVRCVKK